LLSTDISNIVEGIIMFQIFLGLCV
jgi:hypothetical protein